MTLNAAPLTPLQILLAAMRRRWNAGDEEGAVDMARLAAPYLHPRRTNVTTGRADQEPDRLTDAELDTALEKSGAGVALPP